jgi:alpha-L-rhamnosidase
MSKYGIRLPGVLRTAVCLFCLLRSLTGTAAVVDLRTEMIKDPVGLACTQPRFSWKLTGDTRGMAQTAYQLQLAGRADGFSGTQDLILDSGKVLSDQSHLIESGCRPFRSREVVFWRVKVWDNQGGESDWSAPAVFEMGLLDSADWTAKWIKPGQYSFIESDLTKSWLEHSVLRTPGIKPPRSEELVTESLDILRQVRPLLIARKTFSIDGKTGNARLYLGALGFANVFINGRAVFDEWNTPAPTHYKIASRYKVFDVSKFLRPGENVVAVELAAGKYYENPGNHVQPFGDRPVLKLQLEYLSGGKWQTIGTDETWKIIPDRRNPVVHFWAGNVFDATQDDRFLRGGSYDDSFWPNAVLSPADESKRMLSMVIPPETTRENVRPVKQWKIADNVWVFDFGRTIVGRVQLDLPAPDGRKFVVRYADSLRNTNSPEYETSLARPSYPGLNVPAQAVSLGLKRRGNILFRKSADGAVLTGVPTDVYLSPSAGAGHYAPRFGMVPFRYVEVIGFGKEPGQGEVSANIANTAIERTGSFICSDERLNRIHEAAIRTMRYNIHGFCYDNNGAEKGFWPQVFTMNYVPFELNCDLSAYLPYVIEEIDLFTREEGFTCTAMSGRRGEKSAAKFAFLSESEYHIKLPWLHYLYTGDKKPVGSHFDLVNTFVRDWWFSSRFPTLFIADHYGDHTAGTANLDVDKAAFLNAVYMTKDKTPNTNHNNISSELLSTVYATHLLDLSAAISDLMGDSENAAKRRAKRDEIKEAIRQKFYWNKDYGYAVDSRSAQGANVAMMFYQVAQPSEYPELVRAVRDDMKRWNNHISTGSRLTYQLYSVFSSNGLIDEAVDMLTTKRYPSFLSMLDYADTMSESWPMPNAPATTSHCQTEGYSEIAKWFSNDLFGIQPDLAAPGFKHFFLSPRLPSALDSASYTFETFYGPAKIAWKKQAAGAAYEIRIPPNSSATVTFEMGTAQTLCEFGRPVADNAFVKSEGRNASGAAAYRLSSGIYRFEIR